MFKVIIVAMIFAFIDAMVFANFHTAIVNFAFVVAAKVSATAFEVDVPFFVVNIDGYISVGDFPQQIFKITAGLRFVNLHGDIEAALCRHTILTLIQRFFYFSLFHKLYSNYSGV